MFVKQETCRPRGWRRIPRNPTPTSRVLRPPRQLFPVYGQRRIRGFVPLICAATILETLCRVYRVLVRLALPRNGGRNKHRRFLKYGHWQDVRSSLEISCKLNGYMCRSWGWDNGVLIGTRGLVCSIVSRNVDVHLHLAGICSAGDVGIDPDSSDERPLPAKIDDKKPGTRRGRPILQGERDRNGRTRFPASPTFGDTEFSMAELALDWQRDHKEYRSRFFGVLFVGSQEDSCSPCHLRQWFLFLPLAGLARE